MPMYAISGWLSAAIAPRNGRRRTPISARPAAGLLAASFDSSASNRLSQTKSVKIPATVIDVYHGAA